MNLRQESHLSVRNGCDVEKRRFPFVSLAPSDAGELDVSPGTRGQQQAHYGLGAIVNRVHSVEQRRVAIETVLVDFCPRVHIGTRFDERASGVEVPVFGCHVQQGHAFKRGERRNHSGSVLQ